MDKNIFLEKIIIHPTNVEWAIIVMGYSYVPFSDCGLDAYYLASNKFYALQVQRQNTLRQKGAFAQIINDMSLRELAIKSGLVSILGINQMVMRDDCGSYLILGAIQTDDRDTVKHANGHYITRIDKCIDCKKCVKYCPTGALGNNGEFDSKKCLRSFQ
ncbi:MAG: 4Fe-4S binding protein, partial [Clostridiales bacterium]|nr:4Fe-4S binding protein [Clostridiales bacterium]